MALSNAQYNDINNAQRGEFLAQLRDSKINIMAQYFIQADTLLNKVETFPTIQNKDLFNREIGKLEMLMEDFNDPMYKELLRETGNIVELGSFHNDEVIMAGTNSPYTTPQNVMMGSLEKLKMPYNNDVQVLTDAGVFIPAGTTIEGMVNEVVTSSTNRYNKMLETISRIEDPVEREKLMQSLANYIDANDPLGVSVRNVMGYHGISLTIDIKLSTSIWGEDKRDFILQKIIDDSNAGISINQTRDDLIKTLKESGVGGAYYKAERVIDTQLQNAYTQAKVDSGRAYNDIQTIPELQLVLVRELSHSHTVKDICDEMEGAYPLNSGVPMGALHPNDLCKVYTKYLADVDKRTIKNIGNSYTSKITKQKLNLI